MRPSCIGVLNRTEKYPPEHFLVAHLFSPWGAMLTSRTFGSLRGRLDIETIHVSIFLTGYRLNAYFERRNRWWSDVLFRRHGCKRHWFARLRTPVRPLGNGVLIPSTGISTVFAPFVFIEGFSLALVGAALWGLGMGVLVSRKRRDWRLYDVSIIAVTAFSLVAEIAAIPFFVRGKTDDRNAPSRVAG